VSRDADTYLTEAEIERLTGRRYHKWQAKALARAGYTFTLDADGKPIVLRAHHEQRLGLEQPASRRRPRPRFNGLAA
jgi:hypothetical protein